MKIAKGSKSSIILSFSLTAIFLVMALISQNEIRHSFLFSTIVFFLISLFLLLFFRDPEREIAGGIVAAADGKIREITRIGNYVKISTFMNIHNVHVNRMPMNGVVKSVVHHPGTYIPAFKKESERNERTIILTKTTIGMIKITQIAGTIARRIVTYVEEDDGVKKGERIGIIRLGSRVDVYFPSAGIKKINVQVGDKVKAGETTIAEIND